MGVGGIIAVLTGLQVPLTAGFTQDDIINA